MKNLRVSVFTLEKCRIESREHKALIKKETSPYCPIYNSNMWQDRQMYNDLIRNILITHNVLTAIQLTVLP